MDATNTTAEQRGLASGIFNIGKDLGAIVGPLIGGLVAEQVGVGPMMQVVAVTTLVVFWGATAAIEPGVRRARARAAVAEGAARR
jgi:hypothetical protein